MEKANLGRAIVACDDKSIYNIFPAGSAVMTSPTHPASSDHVAEAVELMDPGGTFDVIINVQGDTQVFDGYLVEKVLGSFFLS
jgi:3-deoxy-manno-octulosonate cytidylyltransferase (CMP-KDO synthetase)